MDDKKGWVVVIGVLGIVALVGFGVVWVVMDTVRSTVHPVVSISGELATQVSNVLNPTPTILPSPVTVIRNIRSLARLETIQFSVEKVITAEKNQGMLSALFGDKLILVAHGKVIAGIDLAKMGPDDVELRNGLLIVRLPEPEVFLSALDNEKSYVYNRDTGLLTKGDIHLESGARLAAEKEIEKAAVEDRILDLARQNAETYLTRLLGDLGFSDVIFEYRIKTQTPTPSLVN